MPAPALTPPPVIALLSRSVDLGDVNGIEAACCWPSPPGLQAAMAVDLSLGD